MEVREVGVRGVLWGERDTRSGCSLTGVRLMGVVTSIDGLAGDSLADEG
jgi:hypothetical protein